MKNFFIFILVLLISCKERVEITAPKKLVVLNDNLFPSSRDSSRVDLQLKPRRPRIVITTPGYKCIYIDTDGYTGTTLWQANATYARSGLLQSQTQEVLDRVAFYFDNYKIMVTTDEAIYNGADINNRMRVIVTTTSAWYPNVSGVAYVGSFNWGDNTPCFVFSDKLSYIPSYIGDIVAHEVGHTVGLDHQSLWDANCMLLTKYRESCIMGYPYNTPTPKWSVGFTQISCTTKQNDTLFLASKFQLK